MILDDLKVGIFRTKNKVFECYDTKTEFIRKKCVNLKNFEKSVFQTKLCVFSVKKHFKNFFRHK